MSSLSTHSTHWLKLLLCCALLLAGSAFVWLRAQPLPDRRDFVGTVLDDDGQPLAEAVVTIRPPSDVGIGSFWGAQTVTDENGNFRVPEVEDGKYSVTVELGGYAPLRRQDFVLNRQTARLDVALVKLVNFKLRVLDKAGEPVESSRVSVRMRAEELTTPPLSRRAATTKTGELTLPNMVPGRYKIELIASGAGYGVLEAEEINAKTVEDTGEIRLQPGGILNITARQTDGGKPLSGAMLAIKAIPDDTTREEGQIMPPEDVGLFLALHDRYSLVTDENGTLTLTDVPPGRYSARMLMAGLEPPDAQTIEIKAGETKLGYSFAIPETSTTLKLDLRDDKDKPLPNTEWHLLMRQLTGEGAGPPRLPGGEGLPPGLMVNGHMRRGQTDENGNSVLFPVQPGRWHLTLQQERVGQEGGRPAGATQQIEVPAEGATATFKIRVPASP